ncbi:MAG: hypothetical protein JNM66_34165 [Bryobacterales bacterium]|nr:hypothetical protein [Bryobacterales bacterium]
MTAIPVIVGLSSAVVFLVLLAKLVQRNRMPLGESSLDTEHVAALSEAWSDQWFEDFSSFRYLPMRRLLAAEEEEYWMQSTDGAPSRLAAFRAERRRLFREYLRLISADFGRLSQGVRLSIVHANADRSAEIAHLMSLEWSLRKLLWQAELNLMFHWLGVKPVDATELINALQGFEFSLREVRISGAAA